MRNILNFLALAAFMLLLGCRAQKSRKPPYHLIWNMDFQPVYRAYGENSFFPDGRNMRPPVGGAVARGHLNENTGFHTGVRDSQYVDNPLNIDMSLLERGRERFDIFCAVCHGRTGDGKSIMALKGFTPSPSYQDPRLLEMKDGQLFQVITQGIRNMPALSGQLPAADRWAVVAYVRALQKRVNASKADVPSEIISELK